MPGWPEERPHSCVCGYDTASFANLIVHRRSCDSWQEHIAGVRAKADEASGYRQLPGVSHDPSPTEQPGGRPECPYCERDFGNHPLRDAHLNVCGERATREVVNAAKSSKEADHLADSAAKLLAFEAWCREHGRA